MKLLDEQLKDFKTLFICAPNEQIDDTLKDRIKEWGKVPQSIEILQVLDYAVSYSLASDFSVSVLDIALRLALENEQKTLNDILPQAWWRD